MVKNQGKNSQNSKRARSDEELKDQLETELEKEIPDIWKVLDLREKLGLRKEKIDIIQTREFNLTKGEHYFVMESIGKRSIKCISCPITHGGILEAHLLTRYKLEDGVLYLDDKPQNKAPKLSDVDKDVAKV